MVPIVVVLFSCCALARAGETSEPTLPMKRVVLYKHGVGYFEHAGKVSGSQTLQFSFSQSEMNDVLKSLTAIDFSGGTITTIGYDSKAPPERLLAQFGFALPEEGALVALLGRLRGAEIQATVGQGTIAGSVLGIENRAELRGEQVAQVAVLSIYGDDGRVQSVPVRELNGLRFSDEALSKDLARYLEIVRDTYHRDRKVVQLRVDGQGDRDLFVSYVLETPVWKVSYRLLLGDTNLLQGWAIVDNTSQSDWRDVELSLVSGLPVSFVQDLYSPRYKRRPVVNVEEELALAPQAHEAGWKEEEARRVANAEEDGALDRKAPAPAARVKAATGPPRSTMAEAMQRQQVETAVREIGELFEYQIAHPVSVAKDRSALIPILAHQVDAKRVSLYNASVRSKNPLAAVRLKNTTGLTLEGGPIEVLEKDTYAGEALIETIKAQDERYVSYAVDLALTVDTAQGSSEERIVKVSFLNGAMLIDSDQLRTTTYTIRSGDTVSRDVVIEHPRASGYELIKPDQPLETTPNLYRLAIQVGASKTVIFPVAERAHLQNTIAIGNISSPDLELYVSRKMLSKEMEQALRQVFEARGKLADVGRSIEQRQKELASIAADEDRIRKNLSRSVPPAPSRSCAAATSRSSARTRIASPRSRPSWKSLRRIARRSRRSSIA
ncbi:MAG: hypothetical protein U1E76_04225 [Planctomycetota bacterium]